MHADDTNEGWSGQDGAGLWLSAIFEEPRFRIFRGGAYGSEGLVCKGRRRALEWKGPVIQKTKCAYGKFFAGKAGFITQEWFYAFANYRRDGYDFDARFEDGLLRRQEYQAMKILMESGSLLSREWRKKMGISKRGEFDAIVTRLQMMGYVITIDFEYAKNKAGQAYGVGVARYATPEMYFGEEFREQVYRDQPEESKQNIVEYLKGRFPAAAEKDILHVIR